MLKAREISCEMSRNKANQTFLIMKSLGVGGKVGYKLEEKAQLSR